MSMPEMQMIRCPSCGANNRVPPEKMQAGQVPICGRCKSPLNSVPKPMVVTDANFASMVESSPLPVLLDMWAPWCGPCRTVGPIVDEIAAEMAGRVRVGKMNVDDNPATSARFNVRSIPALLVLDAGREIGRIVGAQPKQQIRMQLERAIQGR